MFKLTRIALLAAALMLPSLTTGAQQPQQPAPAAVEIAKELLAASGSAAQFDVVVPAMLQQMRQIITQSKPEAAKEMDSIIPSLASKFSARKQELIDMIAVIYARKFTTEDMQAMIAFFKSPVGVRFVGAMPQLMQEGMVLGQRWGEQIGREVDQEIRLELKKRGINL